MQDSHLLNDFYVIAVISNPARFASRYKLYLDFKERMKKAGVKLFTVEATLGDRSHKISQSSSDYLQLSSIDELWHKENMINLGVQRLPPNWKYMAWIDADISFTRDDWALETVQQLQHYQVVQMFQSAVDLGPSQEVYQTHQGFMYCYLSGMHKPLPYYTNWHPGFAWAISREAFNSVGGLIDKAVLGAGDRHMALSLIGLPSVESKLHKNYHDMVNLWRERATRTIRKDVGFVPGTILHYFHGKKRDRRYHDRWKILQEHQFDPVHDLKRDWQGLYQLEDDGDERSRKLRDDLRGYFRSRNEDSIDLD